MMLLMDVPSTPLPRPHPTPTPNPVCFLSSPRCSCACEQMALRRCGVMYTSPAHLTLHVCLLFFTQQETGHVTGERLFFCPRAAAWAHLLCASGSLSKPLSLLSCS